MSESTTQYYLLEGAKKTISGITFQPYDIIGGVLWGLYATDKPEEIEALDKEAANPKIGLSKLSYEEFAPMAQKKIPSLLSSPHFQPRPVVTQPKEQSPLPTPPPNPASSPIKGNGAVVDHNPTPPQEQEVISVAPVANVQEALLIGEVAASPTNPPRPSRKSASKTLVMPNP